MTQHKAADVDRAAYLAGLNAAFPNWGGEARFAWCFERTLGGRAPDLLVLRDDHDRIIAGSAIVYRTLARPNGARSTIGIITASWTLPEARGRGAFGQLTDASIAMWPQLICFVTADNASRRGVEARGALGVPTFYCRRAKSLPHTRDDGARFIYSPDEWRSQFLERPAPIEVIETSHFRAVIEDRTRLLYVEGDRDAAMTALADRELFCFSIGAPVSDDYTPGLCMFFGLDETKWSLQNGDRM